MACPQISRQLGGSTTLENSRVLHDINLLMTANITNEHNERTQRAAIPELIRSDNLDDDHENNNNDVRGRGGGGAGH